MKVWINPLAPEGLTETTEGNWLVEAGYMGSESHHLQDLVNANQGLPGPVGTAVSKEPWHDFSTIQEIANGTNAVYNALSLKVTRRFTRGLSVIGSWTWSRSIDDGSDIRGSVNHSDGV